MEKLNFDMNTYCANSTITGQMHKAMLELSAWGFNHLTCALRRNQAELTIYRVSKDQIEEARALVRPFLQPDWEFRKGLLEMRPTPTYFLEFSKEIERNT